MIEGLEIHINVNQNPYIMIKKKAFENDEVYKMTRFCLGLHVLNQQDCCNKPSSVLSPRALDSWGITTLDTGLWFTEAKWCGQAFQPMTALL